MNACTECRELNEQSSEHHPHSQLEYMAEFGGAVAGGPPLMSKRYQCRRCGTHMLRHTEYGEVPGQWEAIPKVDPWYVNGYLVHTDVQETGASGEYSSWYWLTTQADEGRQSRVVVPKTRAASAATNKFTAWAMAAERGKLHADALPPA